MPIFVDCELVCDRCGKKAHGRLLYDRDHSASVLCGKRNGTAQHHSIVMPDGWSIWSDDKGFCFDEKVLCSKQCTDAEQADEDKKPKPGVEG